MKKNPDFLIIPHQLILNNNLQPLDRILYGVIYWLAKLKDEKCTASNQTLKELSGCKTNRAISNSLENLEKQGYILRKYFDEKSKHRDEIIPLIAFNRVGTDNDTPRTDVHTPLRTNDEHNNKSNIIIKANKNSNTSVAEAKKDINSKIELFKPLNPLIYKKWYSNKTQRAAISRLITTLDDKLELVINTAVLANTKKYAPTITCPTQLEEKLSALRAWVIKEKSNLPTIAKIR